MWLNMGFGELFLGQFWGNHAGIDDRILTESSTIIKLKLLQIAYYVGFIKESHTHCQS